MAMIKYLDCQNIIKITVHFFVQTRLFIFFRPRLSSPDLDFQDWGLEEYQTDSEAQNRL